MLDYHKYCEVGSSTLREETLNSAREWRGWSTSCVIAAIHGGPPVSLAEGGWWRRRWVSFQIDLGANLDLATYQPRGTGKLSKILFF